MPGGNGCVAQRGPAESSDGVAESDNKKNFWEVFIPAMFVISILVMILAGADESEILFGPGLLGSFFFGILTFAFKRS